MELSLEDPNIRAKISVDELQVDRPRAMYDRQIHRFVKKICADPFMENQDLREEYLEEFDRFIHGTKLNKVLGLEDYTDRDVIQGVTHVLDDLHQTYGERIVVMAGDYRYHWRLRPDILTRTAHSLAEGDILILSSPFPSLGDLHPDYSAIMERAESLAVPVHIDACWFGCTRGLEFDFRSPAIQSVSFSLSKSMGMGANRIGIRYARQRWNGPISIMNKFNMSPMVMMWLAFRIMRQFGSDYLQNKYYPAYELICEELGLEPTPTIHLAMREDDVGDWGPVGLRPMLRALLDH